MESESVRHKAPHAHAREQRMHCICMCACVHAKPQTLTACKIVCLCRERDVRRRCGRDTTTRIMWNRPRVCDIHGKNMNRQKRANGIRMSQTQKRACACERVHACVMCACVRMPSHRPQTLTGCEIVRSCRERDVRRRMWPRHDDAHHVRMWNGPCVTARI